MRSIRFIGSTDILRFAVYICFLFSIERSFAEEVPVVDYSTSLLSLAEALSLPIGFDANGIPLIDVVVKIRKKGIPLAINPHLIVRRLGNPSLLEQLPFGLTTQLSTYEVIRRYCAVNGVVVLVDHEVCLITPDPLLKLDGD